MAGMAPQRGLVSDINVTPLVDVMLVLLIIFMISASIETLQVQQEKERIEEMTVQREPADQKVPVNLPRTDAEPVNLSEERKVVMTINDQAEFFIGPTRVLACLDLAPDLREALGSRRKAWGEAEDRAFERCLQALEQKIAANEKLKTDREMYLRADRAIPYGMVLKVMARVRRAGVGKFGLIAEPEAREAGP